MLPSAASQAIQEVAEALKAACPVRTGRTRASIRWGGTYPHFEIWAAETLRFLMFGVRPHLILPRIKSALWWPEILGGRPVARVNHPGYPPKLPVSEVEELVRDRFQKAIRREVKARDP